MKKNEQLIIKENKIYPGLIGNLTIKLDLNSVNHNKKLYIYGDNREFGGILIVPSKIKEIVYDNDYCTIKNIVQSGDDGQIKLQSSKLESNGIKISYRNFANWNLYFNDRILQMDVLNNQLHDKYN